MRISSIQLNTNNNYRKPISFTSQGSNGTMPSTIPNRYSTQFAMDAQPAAKRSKSSFVGRLSKTLDLLFKPMAQDPSDFSEVDKIVEERRHYL